MRIWVVLFLVLLVLQIVVANGDGVGYSYEPVIVRVESADIDTRTYTMRCTLPEGADPMRTWDVHNNDNLYALTNYQSTDPLVTVTLPIDDYFHFTCGAFDSTSEPKKWIASDMHIDLRNGPYTDRPNVEVTSTSATSFSASCQANGAVNPSERWSLYFPQTGETTHLTQYEGRSTISYTLPQPGLWSILCGIWDDGQSKWLGDGGLDVEFFSSGSAYIPNKDGCVPGESCGATPSVQNPVCGNGVIESGEQCDDWNKNNGDGCSSSCQVESQELQCYNAVQNIPATCNAGSFSTDSFNGCRTLVCNGKQIKACDKNGFFEMYNEGGSSSTEICIGETCMSNQGYLKSSNFPICTGSSSPTASCGNGVVESGEQCDTGSNRGSCPQTCSQNCQINSCSQSQCYSKVNDMPLTCSGSITQDNKGGCRTVTCSGKQIMACDKNGFFEMYNQGGSSNVEVCLADVCITNQGYVKSPSTPICIGSQPLPTASCGNGVVESGERCDLGSDNGACPSTCSNNCQANSCSQPQNRCYNTLNDLPATCFGGTITQDNKGGCRTIVCGNKQIKACNKGSFFEIYNQGGSSSIEICLADVCLSGAGYVKSSNYPICIGDTSGLSSPQWLEHTSLSNVQPNFFHFEVLEQTVLSTDWEVWNNANTQRVWSKYGATNVDDHHTHTPEGDFEGSALNNGRLDYSTTYRARARFNTNQGQSEWSEWLIFTTATKQVINPDAPMWSTVSGYHVERFATDLDVPVHLAFAPNIYNAYPQNQRPYIYVSELYGKIKVIYEDGSQSVYADNLLNFNPLGSITGGGQMGVTGLYVDQNNGDVYSSMVYLDGSTVKNKVVRFHTNANGRGFDFTQILIDNLPSTPSHQVQQITRGPDGKIYVNLGEGPDQNDAQNDGILAGKIIRMNDDGSNVETYAKGFRNPFGADWRPGFNQLFSTDNSPNSNDRLLYVQQGGNYGWPAPSSDLPRIATLNVSPVDVEFNPGNSGFPSDKTGKLYVAVGGPIYTQGPTQGKQIWEFTLNNDGSVAQRSEFVRYTGTGYGTPIGLDFGPDGLYFTDIYGEPGFVGNGKTEGNIYRVVQGSSSGGGLGGSFRAGVSVHLWYPKLIGNQVEYIFDCVGIDGSGFYTYDFNYGNGVNDPGRPIPTSAIVRYPYSNQDYTVSCTVHDNVAGGSTTASTVINPGGFLPG